MKLKSIFILVLIGLIAANTGCKKDSLKIATMSATIDGTKWDASLASVIATQYSDYLEILGFDLNGKKILISVKGTTTGTYNLLPLEASAETYGIYLLNKDDASDGTKKYLSTNGTVTITKFADGRLSGTFSFTAANSLEDSIIISGGVFNDVPYL